MDIFEIQTSAEGPAGSLPLTPDMLLRQPSGDLFGWTQNAGMGWNPAAMGRPQFLILSTQGGLRAPTGEPVALGYHTGHFEISRMVEAAALEFRALETIPFAGYVSDPCDGRSQGTSGMYDSLPYRNDAAIVFRRLIRSLPARAGVLGVATCDKGLPAMMMALAGMGDLPGVLVPGGVTLPATRGEDAGTIQSLGARYAHGLITMETASELACRACASPGGGCQFLGTAATSQVVAEALGMALPHAALAPSGQPVWLDIATQSARALVELSKRGIHLRHILNEASLRNAMTVHAAFGGSTNLLLHIPAIAHAAGLRRPAVADWRAINLSVPRLVDVLPNGPANHPTVRVFLAGGVPEVMLRLRLLGLLDTSVLTVFGLTLEAVLNNWETSERRKRFKQILRDRDGVDPDDVILPSAAAARARGMSGTIAFLQGNIAPEGAIVKSTSIDPSVIGPDNVYRQEGPARIFPGEPEAIRAIKEGRIRAGDVMVVMGGGPLGAGMEETYQVTSALKHLPFGKHVALITDARFSGVSTGACIGHVGPEALAGGPIGALRENDLIRVVIQRKTLDGSIDMVGEKGQSFTPEEGAAVLAARPMLPGLAPASGLPDDTKLWAALQSVSGGAWGGCVYDTEAIIKGIRPEKMSFLQD